MHDISYSSTVLSTAIKSDCGLHRYVLKRVWDSEREIGAFLCANPSKADHLLSDDTVFKCGNLAAQWGWGGLYVLNLHPAYSTDPRKMKSVSEAEERNTVHVNRVLAEVQTIVLACGNGHGSRLNELIAGISKDRLFCLQQNKGGGFLHPSRIRPEAFLRPIPAFATSA
jgi:hypothetical protein